jgi:hypothetical protein
MNGINTLLARRYDVPTQKDALPLPFRSADIAYTPSEVCQCLGTTPSLTGRAVTRIVASSATIKLTKAKVRTINHTLRLASQAPFSLTSMAVSISAKFASGMMMLMNRIRLQCGYKSVHEKCPWFDRGFSGASEMRNSEYEKKTIR